MADQLRSHTCEQCGAAFVGGVRAQYCPDCRAKRDREAVRASQAKSRDRERRAVAEGAEAKPAAARKKKKGPNTKQCRGCTYWGRITGAGDVTHCCHYLQYTGKQRERDGDRCLSRTTKAVKPNQSPWPESLTGESVYAGYGRK